MNMESGKYGKERWLILAALFLVTFINYFDRQTLGCAIEPIAAEFGLDNAERGHLLAAFVTSYAIAHLFVGFLTDRVRNVRRFFSLMVVGWSLSTVLIGFSRSYHSLLVCRYALGVFEAVNFPLCLMIIAKIFPAKERTLASGIFSSGGFLATMAAPKFTIWLSTDWSWRYSFFAAGILGLLWLIPWLMIKEEYTRSDNASIGRLGFSQVAKSLKEVLRRPGFWGVTAVGIGIVPCLYFCTQWLPSYFTHELEQVYDQGLADKLTVIYLFQDVGMWFSGALVFFLTGKGYSVLTSRKIIMSAGYLFMMSVVLLPFIRDPWANVAIFSVFIAGMGICLANQHAFKQDVLPGQVATVAALVGFCETFFTSVVLQQVGVWVDMSGNFAWTVWLLAGCATFAIVSAFLFLRDKWLTIK